MDCHHFINLLVENAHPRGGWGYGPGQDPQIEPTCLGLLALSLEPSRHADLITAGRRFLDGCQAPDGSFPLARSRQEAFWPTALALFLQASLNYPWETIRRTAGRLLSFRGKIPAKSELGELHDIDLNLIGWPWGEGNFSWVEPTAWACLALRRAGLGDHPHAQEGFRLLLDRAMDEGGINYGNRRILGRLTEPIPGPTAIMLLALQQQDHPRIRSALVYLEKHVDCADLEHLAWIKLALETHREKIDWQSIAPKFDAAIVAAFQERQQISWLGPAILRLALTALALGTNQKNPFRLPGDVDEEGPGKAPSKAVSTKAPPDIPIPSPVPPKRTLRQRFGSWVQSLAVKMAGQVRPLPEISAVHIARAPSYEDDLAAILQLQYQSFRTVVPLAGKRVVLKPNLVEYHRDKVINTNPRVVAAVIELCRREGAKDIIVAEGPGHWRNVEYLVQASGLGDVLKQYQVPFVDINHDVPVKTPNLGRLTGLESLYVSKTILDAEVLISLPKLKTHHWAGATLSLKNLFGTLPGICYGWPKNELHWRGIDNSIVDIALTRTPDLAIVDGIVGMEGDGPLNGVAKPFGALIMGHDLVAVDATCCRLMQLDPEKIGYLILGQAKKLGRLNAQEIPQLGEPIESLSQPFETVPHLTGLQMKRSA